MDAIVVDDEKTAIECINYMRDQRAGQATFLPLDKIQVKPINEKYRSFAKGARLALDVVQFENECEKAVRYVMGNALISDSVEIARYVCYERNQEVKVVALDGTIFHKTGNITGGQSQEDSSLSRRWEEKEVDELKKKREELTTKLNEILKDKRKVYQDDHIQSEIQGSETRLIHLQEDFSTISQKIESCDTELLHLADQIKKSNYELDNVY